MRTIHEDVSVLGQVLGAVLREQRGQSFYELVERVRKSSQMVHELGNDGSELQAQLASVPLEDAEGLVRAFSLYFRLVNMAEEHERVRQVASRPGPRKEGIEAALRELAARGMSADEVATLIQSVDLGLTFTAHPTEMRRRTVREHLATIADEIPTLDDADSLQCVTAHVEALWGTLELLHVQPTVHDEVQGGLAYIPVIAQALPTLARDLKRAFRAVFDREMELELPVSFHSWMGGDRDGNPNVTSAVTAETFDYHSDRAKQLLRDEILKAYASLSQHSDRLETVPDSVAGPEEPWRQILQELHRKLRVGESVDPLEVATLVEATLREAGQSRSADQFATPLRVLARAFGAHLVSLDVREHSGKTGAVVAELLQRAGINDYARADEARKREILLAELRSRRPLLAVGEEISSQIETVLGPLRAVRTAVQASGGRAFGRYITSMSEQVSDLLEVLVLAREAGVHVYPVPLFETREDLMRAPSVLREVLSIPLFREHLGDDIQEIMIGYSDSNKDAGFFAANWALYEAQEKIADACREAGVKWRFFHGRGTSIGRGGGPMVRGLLGQPPGTIGAGLRITEQGEALADKYSHPELARRNLEQGIYGVLIAAAAERTPLPARWADAMSRAAESSANTYRALVEHPQFISFFEAVTPINEFSALRIASRPVRRPGAPTLGNLRAIPWVMSWTQNRANVPGWYGLHVALKELGVELGRELYGELPFFRSMLDNAQMALAMSEASIFRTYLRLMPGESELGPLILSAREEATSRVEEITGAPILANEPRILRSIGLRNPYVEPIHRLQVELLAKVRASGESVEPALERALLLSIHGIAAGVRNSG